MARKLHRLLVPLAAAAFATAPMAAPAQAATGYDRCPDDHYCMFSGLDGTGDMIAIQADTPDLGALGMDNRAKSDWNRTDERIHLFSDTNYTGCSAVTAPSGSPSDRGNFYIDFRDYFSSVRIGGEGGRSCTPPPGEG
ncbi:MAG TPA: peptidase inhibitor family I36 protein [Actinopolymorphaceae bacterium]